MTELAIPALALSAYLQNVVCGRTMREIAANLECEPSTAMRRIRQCEELRDHPEWESVLCALEGYRRAWPARFLIGRKHVLAALDLTADGVAAEFARHLPALQVPGATIVAGDFPRAAIMCGDAVAAMVDRKLVLAALAFGWVVAKDGGAGKARKFAPAASLRQVLEPDPATAARRPRPGDKRNRYCPEPLPIVALMRRRGQQLVTADHLRAAQEFEVIYHTRDGANADTWRAICAALPPRIVRVLEETCGKRTGFEALEDAMKLPARSGKAVLALALDALMHAGFPA